MTAPFAYQTVRPRKDKRKRVVQTESGRQRVDGRARALDGFFESFNKVWTSAQEEGCELDQVDRIVCLGLGRVAVHANSIDQLALLQKIMDLCEISPSKVTLYDPMFEDDDRRLLEDCNLEVVQNEPKLEISTNEIVLFYLPHAPSSLVERILAANSAPSLKQNIRIIGNSLSEYPQSLFRQQDIAKVPHIFAAAKSFHHLTIASEGNIAFAYLAVQWSRDLS